MSFPKRLNDEASMQQAGGRVSAALLVIFQVVIDWPCGNWEGKEPLEEKPENCPSFYR